MYSLLALSTGMATIGGNFVRVHALDYLYSGPGILLSGPHVEDELLSLDYPALPQVQGIRRAYVRNERKLVFQQGARYHLGFLFLIAVCLDYNAFQLVAKNRLCSRRYNLPFHKLPLATRSWCPKSLRQNSRNRENRRQCCRQANACSTHPTPLS